MLKHGWWIALAVVAGLYWYLNKRSITPQATVALGT
jgi:hypothetical protein